MKINRICSIMERGISADELVSHFLFGDTLPAKFDPEKEYKHGDLVYTVNTGVLSIYQCMKDGMYEDVENDPNWTTPVIDEITSGNSPVFGNLVVISKEEPDNCLIWIRPSKEKMINPDILL